MLLLPQIVIAASCTIAVVTYVVNNIDEIREKQKVAVEKTITEQNATIKSVEEKQRDDIARIKREQEQNILKIKRTAEEARSKANDRK